MKYLRLVGNRALTNMTQQTGKTLINIWCQRDYVWDWQPGEYSTVRES